MAIIDDNVMSRLLCLRVSARAHIASAQAFISQIDAFLAEQEQLIKEYNQDLDTEDHGEEFKCPNPQCVAQKDMIMPLLDGGKVKWLCRACHQKF